MGRFDDGQGTTEIIRDVLYMTAPSAMNSIDKGALVSGILYPVLTYVAESSGLFNIGYSKFAKEDAKIKIPSKIGMTWAYFPSFVWSTWKLLQFLVDKPFDGRSVLVAALLTGHFGKRLWEVQYLHKYSGSMQLDAMILPSMGYFSYSYLICRTCAQIPKSSKTSYMLYVIGLAAYFVGQYGNYYHHWLLANLRKDTTNKKTDETINEQKPKKRYELPTGGYFEYVACPHYFFETIAWGGIAVISKHVQVYFITIMILGYLSGRSIATTKFNRKNIENYPESRKNIIPFVF